MYPAVQSIVTENDEIEMPSYTSVDSVLAYRREHGGWLSRQRRDHADCKDSNDCSDLGHVLVQLTSC